MKVKLVGDIFHHEIPLNNFLGILLGLLDWRAGGRKGFCSQMKWNESEASIGRVLAIEVGISVNFILPLEFEFLSPPYLLLYYFLHCL